MPVRADRAGDERVRGFYPSLHVNLAKAHQELGRSAEAREHYEAAAARIADVPAGPYAEGLRFAIGAGLAVRGGVLDDVFGRLCARTDLMTLGLLLPAYLGNLGTPEDRVRLLTAVHMVHTGRRLPDDEQLLVQAAIAKLNAHPASPQPASS